MNSFTRRVLFFLFFVSGFSSLVYQVVWTRMAFASFGIITPVLSVVLSMFMLGLAIGSWVGGRWIGPLTAKTGRSAAFFYAGAELVIGLGAFAVPKIFAVGEKVLLASGETDSFGYLALSALVLAVSILPWCICMGTTFPFMMAYIREQERDQTRSFSFLYLANVLGAMSGTLLAAAVCIELLGFQHTLWEAAAGNFVIAFISVSLGLTQPPAAPLADTSATSAGAGKPAAAPRPLGGTADGMIKWVLFSTGFIAMAMEVVWTRAFAPVLKTQVYSFAAIVFTYLGATFIGSWWYRRAGRTGRPQSWKNLIPALAFTAFLPVVLNTPKVTSVNYLAELPDWLSVFVLLGSIVPFCALLGYLTPGLVDELAGGNPARAGRAYALNVFGCILGPLVACYGLLPQVSERFALVILSLPLLFFCFQLRRGFSRLINQAWPMILGLTLAWAVLGTEDFEGKLHRQYNAQIRRDYTATVISFAADRQHRLLVNGIGMTTLTPLTKFMVHLPLAFHAGPSQSALIICFGMGTSYRSALSWNLDTTAVELVPSVARAFGFYHADAAQFMQATNGHIITDDGRRFLKRTTKKFDVIVVDPPPPVEAAGSSLLYSMDFCVLAKQHLKPGGILQMWFPGDPNMDICQAAIRSMQEAFPYLRCFPSFEGWGLHMLGSMEPIPNLDGEALAARLPDGARRDLMEWATQSNAPAYLNLVLGREYSVPACLNPNPTIQITDDAPYNEYYLLRRLFHPKAK